MDRAFKSKKKSVLDILVEVEKEDVSTYSIDTKACIHGTMRKFMKLKLKISIRLVILKALVLILSLIAHSLRP